MATISLTTTDDGTILNRSIVGNQGSTTNVSSNTPASWYSPADDDDPSNYGHGTFYFPASPVSQMNAINSATLKLTVASNPSTSSTSLTITVRGFKKAESRTDLTTTGTGDINNFRTLATSINSGYTVGGLVVGTEYSFDVTDVVQEIIDYAGWQEDGIVLFVEFSATDSNDRNTNATTWEAVGSSSPAVLDIDYDNTNNVENITGTAVGFNTNNTQINGVFFASNFPGDDDDSPMRGRSYANFSTSLSSSDTVISAKLGYTYYAGSSNSQSQIVHVLRASTDYPLPTHTSRADIDGSNYTTTKGSYVGSASSQRVPDIDVTSAVQDAVNSSGFDGNIQLLTIPDATTTSKFDFGDSAGGTLYLSIETAGGGGGGGGDTIVTLNPKSASLISLFDL